MSNSSSPDVITRLLGRLELDTTLFHVGQYCGTWQATTSGMERASFHLVLHGECRLHLPGREHEEEVVLQRGDAVFLLRDLPYCLLPPGQDVEDVSQKRGAMTALDISVPGATGLVCGFFQFRPGISELIIRSLPDHLVLRSYSRELAGLRAVFDLIREEALQNSGDDNPLIKRLTDVLFLYAIRHLMTRQEQMPGLLAVTARREFAPLLAELLDEPGADWSVEKMAEHARLSRATFLRRFSELAGFSPAHFLLCVRMHKAGRLLQQGLPVTEVAEQVGYQSVAAFSRAFQKVTQLAPGAYRRATQG